MIKIILFILLCLLFSLPSFSQEWGTIFPSDKEIAEIDKAYAGKKNHRPKSLLPKNRQT